MFIVNLIFIYIGNVDDDDNDDDNDKGKNFKMMYKEGKKRILIIINL